MTQEDQVFLLTQEAYDKMQEELKWREGSTAMRSSPRSPPRVPKAI